MLGKEFDSISDEDLKILADMKDDFSELQQFIPFLDGQSVKDKAGITDEEVLQLHATACSLFEKGKLNESELIFRQLVLIDAANVDYCLGLGAVLQRKKLYSKAADIYAVAHVMQRNVDSRPMFYAGQCLFFDREHDKAKIAFEQVIADNHAPELSKMAALFIEAIERGKKA